MDHEAFAATRVGTTLRQKWTLEKVLGVGGMAAVYVAVHKIGRREAIKILHRDVAEQPDLRARFEQEAQAVNRFQHPGVVEVRDIDVAEDGSPFLVMELLSGESLGERARRLDGIATDELLRLVDELLDVLAAAHARGIVHRDIKLDNLFVQTDGRLKVLDFGIARVRDGLPVSMRTRVGATLGTAPYMPPEQIKGHDVDARADIFAVGATMFRLLARRRIHEAPNETKLLLKMATEPAPPISTVAPNVPRDVGLVVDRALEFDRDRRYPDALTMQADVRALRAGAPPPYASAHTGEPRASARSDVPTLDGRAQAFLVDANTAAASPAAMHPNADAPTKVPMAAMAANLAGTELSLPGAAMSIPIPISVALPSAQLFTGAASPPASVSIPVSMPAISPPVSTPPISVTAERDPTTPGRGLTGPSLPGAEPTLRSPQTVDPSTGTSKTKESAVYGAPMSQGPASAVSIAQPSPPRQNRSSARNPALLIAIGAAFLLLGIAITLALALHGRGANATDDADAGATADDGSGDSPDSDIGAGTGKKPPSRQLGPSPGGLSPAPPAPATAPGKSHGKGHK